MTTAMMATGPILAGTRFINRQTSAAVLVAIDSSYCFFRTAAHFNKAKAATATGLTIHYDLSFDYDAKLRKQLGQVLVRRAEWQIPHVQILAGHRSIPFLADD
jgi:hypothetical protein